MEPDGHDLRWRRYAWRMSLDLYSLNAKRVNHASGASQCSAQPEYSDLPYEPRKLGFLIFIAINLTEGTVCLMCHAYKTPVMP